MAEVKKHYDVTHHWGTEPYTSDDQAEMWLSWDTTITIPNDLEYVDVLVENIRWATRKGSSQPWGGAPYTGRGMIDAYIFGFSAPGAEPIYVWPDCYIIPWPGGIDPVWDPMTELENFKETYDQFPVVYPELIGETEILEGSFMRTDAVYGQVSFPNNYVRTYVADLYDVWNSPYRYTHRYITNGYLPNPLKLFRYFMRYMATSGGETHFFDGIIEEELEEPITKYFPWAIYKHHDSKMIWKSCNRFSEEDPDKREGQLEIRNELAGEDNVLNDYVNARPQNGFHFREGEWKRQPLNGWWSGPDLPWDGVNEAPPIGMQMAWKLAADHPVRIVGHPKELGDMKVTVKTLGFKP